MIRVAGCSFGAASTHVGSPANVQTPAQTPSRTRHDFLVVDMVRYIIPISYGNKRNCFNDSMCKISLPEKFALIGEHWRPKVAARLNGQELKLVKFAGVFPWHHHEREDELFLVWRGQMTIEFRDQPPVTLGAGELCVVPHGVEHRTLAETEAEVLIFEPAATRNTGDVTDTVFTAPNDAAV